MDQIKQQIVSVQTVIDHLNKIIASNNQSDQDILSDDSFLTSLVDQNTYTFVNPEIIRLDAEKKKIPGLTKPDDFLDEKFIDLLSGLSPSRTTELKKDIADGLLQEIDAKYKELETDISNLKASLKGSLAISIAREIKKKIDYLLSLLNKLDPQYTNKINLMSVTLSIVPFDTDVNSPYTYTQRALAASSPMPITYKDMDTFMKNIDFILNTKPPNGQAGPIQTIFVPVRTQYATLADFFKIKVFDTIKTDLPGLIQNYLDKIKPKQIGGFGMDDVKKIITRSLIRKLNVLEANEFLPIYNTKLFNLTQILNSISKPSGIASIDYFSPFIALIQYNAGNITPYDTELIKYCEGLGFSTNTILAIYFAQRKSDIQQIILATQPNNSYSIMNILRLKKMSAHQKFKSNYGLVTEEQIRVLIEKKIIY